MGALELDHDVHGIQARVLGQGPRDGLHGLGESLDGQLLTSSHRGGVGRQPKGELDLGRSSTWDGLAILEGYADHAQGVMHGPVHFLDDMLGTAAQHEADGLGVLASGDEGHVLLADLPVVDELGAPQVRALQLIYIADQLGPGGLGELLHVRLLEPAAGIDVVFGKVVLDQVVDALLAEDYGRTDLLELVRHVPEAALFLVEEALHGRRVSDLDLGLDLGLLDL